MIPDLIFTASIAAICWVITRDLLPALPRMVALFEKEL